VLKYFIDGGYRDTKSANGSVLRRPDHRRIIVSVTDMRYVACFDGFLCLISWLFSFFRSYFNDYFFECEIGNNYRASSPYTCQTTGTIPRGSSGTVSSTAIYSDFRFSNFVAASNCFKYDGDGAQPTVVPGPVVSPMAAPSPAPVIEDDAPASEPSFFAGLWSWVLAVLDFLTFGIFS